MHTASASSQPVWTLGVNYWPRRKAMYWWKRFDAGEVRDELAQIASWGLSLVRICLLWEDFQPAPDRIDGAALTNLATVLDVAQAAGLQVMPTLIVGNMSGVFWFPRWAYSEHSAPRQALWLADTQPTDHLLRDLYGDPEMLRAHTRLAEAVAEHLGSHPALWGWDLANEIDATGYPTSDDAGWLWVRTLAAALRFRDAAHPITYGAHTPSLSDTNHLRIDDMATSLDILSMHGYPIYSDVAAAPLDPEFVPFATVLTAALGGKPAMMQEFGLCTAAPGEPSHTIQDDFLGQPQPQFLASEEDAAAYYDAVLGRLRALRVPGALAWCYADYTADLWDRPPLDRAIRERSFGLVRADGSEKPAIAVLRRHAMAPAPGPVAVPDVLNGLTPAAYYADPKRHFAELYAHWRAARSANVE
ncbi:MAG TPA: beta-galactosidase [Chloroflexota bacterium]|nr:beta-galactosidase [Chloroflexota bacterium]